MEKPPVEDMSSSSIFCAVDASMYRSLSGGVVEESVADCVEVVDDIFDESGVRNTESDRR